MDNAVTTLVVQEGHQVRLVEIQPVTVTPGECQSVVVTLSNGLRAIFTGPVLVRPGDEQSIRVVGIHFTTPEPLPPRL